MTDEEYRQQVQERWQETMALLGFDDAGPAPEHRKDEAEPVADLPAASRIEEASPCQSEAPHTNQTESPAQPQQRFDSEQRDRHEPQAAMEVPIAATSETAMAEPGEEGTREAPAAAEEAGTEDEPERRHRGRRGRRGKKPEAVGTEDQSEGEVPSGERPAGAKDESAERDGRGRRGRGRPRQRTAKPEGPQAAAKDEAAMGESAGDSDVADDESDNLSEWNVPSWQELIASLYRPER